MSRKFLLVIVFSLTAFLFFGQSTQAAVNTVAYNNPVRVEVASENTGVTTSGFYQIKNLTDNSTLLLKSGLVINFQKSPPNLKASFGAYSWTSSKGFEVSEVTGAAKYVTFSGPKGAKRNASTTDPDVVMYNNGEAAEYVSSYPATNPTWYLIKAKNGSQLAVQIDSSVGLVNAAGVNTFKINNGATYNQFRGSFQYIFSSTNAQLVNILPMQSYLKGVLPNEVMASWHPNALKTQAVAARSYAYVKNQRSVLTRTTSSQMYEGLKSEDSRTNQAVDETNEQYVKYNGKVIETFFYSTSGGRTASVGDVWNSNQASFPYLTSVEDQYENSPHSNWKFSYSSRTILDKFGFGANTLLTGLSSSQEKVNGTGNTTNGEISGITLMTTDGSKTITGNESAIRKLFPTSSTYYYMLPSNWFTITADKQFVIQTPSQAVGVFGIKGASVQLANSVTTVSVDTLQFNNSTSIVSIPSDPPSITLNGKGFGHRIGMSQYGAKGYAEHGWTYQQILTHYYPGTTIGGL